jgi:D-alanyl-D-alanine carboxypeptidase/D-alanyl-D-alanine-endopeptidase (penicillin-binding protein 4)
VRVLGWVPELLVVLLVALALVEVQYDVAHRWLGIGANADANPAAVLPPEGLDIADPAAAPLVAEPVIEGAGVDPVSVAAAVLPYVRDKHLGRHEVVYVSDLHTGEIVYRHGSGPVIPASTLKLLTTAAALEVLGPMATFSTTVQRRGSEVFLVGGGDPFLASRPTADPDVYPHRADLRTLARRTAQTLRKDGVTRVRLRYDDSLFTGPAVNPAWPDTYLPEDVVPPITALWADEGHAEHYGFVRDPSAEAASDFRRALVAAGIKVVGRTAHRITPAAAEPVASVASAPVGEIVQQTLAVSDNQAAEVLARHVGIAVLHDATFAGGARAVRQVLTRLGVPMQGVRTYDGSGLSRKNRLTPEALLATLRLTASDSQPDLREVITGLPVAGFTGSLQWRFEDAPRRAKGLVRAKTGTLTGVHGLAGIVTDRTGAELGFVAIADRVAVRNTLEARKTIDELAAALGACACGG